MRVLILTVLAVCLFPASAGAVELVNPDGSVAQPYQVWTNPARVPLAPGRIVVFGNVDQCPADPAEIFGCAFPDSINLKWDCSKARSVRLRRSCRFTFWHEAGHHYGWSMSAADQNRVARIVGFPWRSDDDYTEEVFADSYALCQMPWMRNSDSAVAGEPKHHRRICKMLLGQKKNPADQ